MTNQNAKNAKMPISCKCSGESKLQILRWKYVTNAPLKVSCKWFVESKLKLLRWTFPLYQDIGIRQTGAREAGQHPASKGEKGIRHTGARKAYRHRQAGEKKQVGICQTGTRDTGRHPANRREKGRPTYVKQGHANTTNCKPHAILMFIQFNINIW